MTNSYCCNSQKFQTEFYLVQNKPRMSSNLILLYTSRSLLLVFQARTCRRKLTGKEASVWVPKRAKMWATTKQCKLLSLGETRVSPKIRVQTCIHITVFHFVFTMFLLTRLAWHVYGNIHEIPAYQCSQQFSSFFVYIKCAITER